MNRLSFLPLALLSVVACADDDTTSRAGLGENGGVMTSTTGDPSTANSGGGSAGDPMTTTGGGNDPGGSAGGSNGGSSAGSTGEPPLGRACDGRSKANVAGAAPSFTMEELSNQPGAAYMRPVDLDGDDFPELLLTALSEGVDILGGGMIPLADGGAYVLKRSGGAPDGTLGTWETQKVFDKSAKIGFPNESEHFDVDGDGIEDWMIGAGFLIKPTGKIVWMKGGADGTFGAPISVPVPDTTCWYHSTIPLDIDDDGDNDFVTSCHVGTTADVNGPSRVEWYENDGEGNFIVHPIGDGGGAIVTLYDLDEDGDLDVVAPQFFGPESIVWFEQTGAAGASWAKHIINNTTGRGFIARFADMNGDGRTDMVYGNHNNQQAAAPNDVMGIYWFEIPPKEEIRSVASWDAWMHTIYEGFEVPPNQLMPNADSAGAPGMISVGDIDGDCDIDIAASGDGDRGLYLFVQQDGGFERVDLFVDDANENSGEQHMIDLDGDGDLDLIWAVFGPAGLGSLFGLDSHVYAFLQN